MNPPPTPSRRCFTRLALVLALAAAFAAPRADAQNFVFNGATVVRPVPKTQPLFVNSGVVVSPTLTAPTQITGIVRRQGTVTHNLLVIKPLAKKATFTYGVDTPTPTVATGTCTVATAGFSGSTVTVTLTSGSPKGTMLFRIQPGAVNVYSNLKFIAPAFTSHEHFFGTVTNPPVTE